jgi:hypothetical protein
MKIIFSTLVLFIVLSASAQKPEAPPSIEERLKHTKEILGKELKLNLTQLATTSEAFNKFFRQVDLLFKDNPPPPNSSQLKQIEGFEKERDSKIISILTQDQIRKFKEVILKIRPPKPGQGNQQGLPPHK